MYCTSHIDHTYTFIVPFCKSSSIYWKELPWNSSKNQLLCSAEKASNTGLERHEDELLLLNWSDWGGVMLNLNVLEGLAILGLINYSAAD